METMSLQVGLFAPIQRQGGSSGVGRYVMSLTRALATLQSDASLPTIEYTLVTAPGTDRWVGPQLREQMALASKSRPTDTFFADLGLDVVHYLVPTYAETDRATVFNPHGLQHRVFPDQFSRRLVEHREAVFPVACREATVVDVPSQATRETVVAAYDCDPAAVQSVPMGPSITPANRQTAIPSRDDLPEAFALYPAKSWPYKNHARLFDALGYVSETYDTEIPVVCTGSRETPAVASEHRIADLTALDSSGLVYDLGFVESDRLRALYAQSRLLVYPTLYETGGLPVLEGWAFDTPVACSAIPPLREKGGDAAAYFDPASVPEMGDTIHRLWTDGSRRSRLVERGRTRRERFTWTRTARLYHALYRKAVGHDLSETDRQALRYPDET
jgi:glycosyltransferase involved in cell wall biosynthesis